MNYTTPLDTFNTLPLDPGARKRGVPRPPVPADCDLRDVDVMPFNVSTMRGRWGDDFRAGLILLRMMMFAWHQLPAGSIPSTKSAMRLATGSGQGAHFADIDTSGGWVLHSDRRYYHPALTPHVLTAWKRKQAEQRKAVKAGAAPRSRRCPPGLEAQLLAIAESMPVPAGLIARAELVMFMDHEFHTPRSDWPATWRNWLRRAAKHATRNWPREGDRVDRQLSTAGLMVGSTPRPARRIEPDVIENEARKPS